MQIRTRETIENTTELERYLRLKRMNSNQKSSFTEYQLTAGWVYLYSTFCKKHQFGLALNCIEEGIKIIESILQNPDNPKFKSALQLYSVLANKAHDFILEYNDFFSDTAYSQALNRSVERLQHLYQLDPSLPHRQINSELYLVSIQSKEYKNNKEKINFLGKRAKFLRRSANESKVRELLNSLKSNNCWEKPIFNDSYLPKYAMTAFLEGKITREHITQILEFHELKLTFPDLITIPIFTQDGNFTEASEIYFKALRENSKKNLPNVTWEHLK